MRRGPRVHALLARPLLCVRRVLAALAVSTSETQGRQPVRCAPGHRPCSIVLHGGRRGAARRLQPVEFDGCCGHRAITSVQPRPGVHEERVSWAHDFVDMYRLGNSNRSAWFGEYSVDDRTSSFLFSEFRRAAGGHGGIGRVRARAAADRDQKYGLVLLRPALAVERPLFASGGAGFRPALVTGAIRH